MRFSPFKTLLLSLLLALGAPALAQSQASSQASSQAGFYAGWPTIYPNWWWPPTTVVEPDPRPPVAPSGMDLTTQRYIPRAKIVEWAQPSDGYARVVPRSGPVIQYW